MCSLCFRFWHGFLDFSQKYLGMILNAEDINSYEDAHMHLYPYQYAEDDDGENGGSGESDIAGGEGGDINGDDDGGNAGGDGSDGDNRGDGEDAVSVVSSDAQYTTVTR